MTKHRAFNADRFVDKFQGHEPLLQAYAKLWGNGLQVYPSSLDTDGFKEFLVNGDGDAKDQFLEELYRIHDLCTERGHEDVVAACRDLNYDPDPKGSLPVECLTMKVRTENEDAFNLAYDRSTLQQAERFSVYQGDKGRPITNVAAATRRLQKSLAEVFKGDKHSDRVLVRQFQEGPYTNFIVYHEKRTQSLLIFKGTRTDPKVSPTVLRPAQQDFISYNGTSGQVEIEARFEKEDESLRKCFAECCLGDADVFEKPEASRRLDLGRISTEDFSMPVDGDDTAALIELHFSLKQKHGPSFVVRSKDVLETLQLNYLHRKISDGTVKRAVFKIAFPDDRRGKRVELSGTNKISFKRATHAEDVFRYLRKWKILVD